MRPTQTGEGMTPTPLSEAIRCMIFLAPSASFL
jgi:hypothetical protein